MEVVKNDVELKPGAETTANAEQAPAAEKKSDSPEGRADDLKTTGDDVDYKAELERARADSTNYKTGLLEAKRKIKALEADRVAKSEPVVDEEELREQAGTIVRQELDRCRVLAWLWHTEWMGFAAKHTML